MEIPHSMTTLTSVMEKLALKNIANEFRWTPKGFTSCNDTFYQPEDLEIIKVYRFEEISNPSDMAVLYVIRAVNSSFTGYSLDAYGTYSNHDDEEGYDNFIRMIPEINHQEQLLFSL
ncbi:MAG: hypothetical protein QM687_15385 [Ferruginibacter sp.]